MYLSFHIQENRCLSPLYSSPLVQDTIGEYRLLSPKDLEKMAVNLEIVDAAYYGDDAPNPAQHVRDDLMKRKALTNGYVEKFFVDASVLKPAYFIAVDHKNKNIILNVRGTSSPADLITDLAG